MCWADPLNSWQETLPMVEFQKLSQSSLIHSIYYLNHFHTWALSDRLLPDLQTQVYKPLFQSNSWLLPLMNNTLSYTIKCPCFPCFLHLTDLNIHKQLKTQASWVSATDSYGEKSLPALSCNSRIIRIKCLQTTYWATFNLLPWVDIPKWVKGLKYCINYIWLKYWSI